MQKAPKKIKDFTVSHTDEDGKETSKKTYQLVEPTAKQVRDARWHYSVVFSQALRDGLMTERQMSEVLNHGKVLNDEDTTKLASLYLRGTVVESELAEKSSSDERLQLASELRDIRAEIFQMENAIRAPYHNTAEQRAEEARIDFLLPFLIRDSKNPQQRIWDSEEEFESEMDYELVETAKANLLYWIHNLDENWEQKLPENVAFKEIREEASKEQEQEKAKAEDNTETPVKEKPAPKAKKRPRKKAGTKKANEV